MFGLWRFALECTFLDFRLRGNDEEMERSSLESKTL
jgi:hypothetical protein